MGYISGTFDNCFTRHIVKKTYFTSCDFCAPGRRSIFTGKNWNQSNETACIVGPLPTSIFQATRNTLISLHFKNTAPEVISVNCQLNMLYICSLSLQLLACDKVRKIMHSKDTPYKTNTRRMIYDSSIT